jgi:very-short-patch-repair endonuclease
METCKICGKEYKNKRNLSAHIRKIHNIEWYDYLKQIGEFPKCKYCNNDVKIRSGGYKLSVLCDSQECLTKSRKDKMTPQVRKILSRKRLDYMKENPEKTAWRTKTISYPEKLFLNKLYELKWNEKFNIVREEPIFPYFIDFAFIDLKIAVEIDGSQHKLEERKQSDIKKDKLLKKNGWRVLRIEATNLYHEIDKVFEQLDIFINESSIDFSKIEIFPEILKSIELKNIKRKKERKERKKKERESKDIILKKRFNDYQNIEKTNGYVGKLANMWGVSHTQVRRHINNHIAR